MRRILAGVVALCLTTSFAFAQSSGVYVRQSGSSITPDTVPYWVISGAIGGTVSAADSPVTSFGVTNNGGTGFCVNSDRKTAAGRNQLCFSVGTSSAAIISLQNYGTAAAQGLEFEINGATQGFPVVSPLPVTVNDFACFGTTAGSMKDCGFDLSSLFANPTGAVGLTAVDGTATTAMRSDAAPPLSSAVQTDLTGTNNTVLLGTGAFGFSSATAGTNNQAFMGVTNGAPAFRALVGADLPNPSATSLGGVESYASVSHQWINTISTSGVPASSQPNFTDLAGSIAGTQIPNGTITNAMLAGSITLSNLATQNANTVVANVTASSASPAAASLPSCSTAQSVLQYTSSTGFNCATFGTASAQTYTAGTWTPTLIGSSSGAATYTTQVGSYEQIGEQVTARFTIVTASVSGITGDALIGGLPVTIANVANDTGSCFISRVTGFTADTSYTYIGGNPIVNTTTVGLYENGSGVAAQQFGGGRLAAATTLVGTCFYHS